MPEATSFDAEHGGGALLVELRSGRRIEVRRGFDAATLESLLTVLDKGVAQLQLRDISAALAPASGMRPEANSNKIQFLIGHASVRPNGTSDAGRTSEKRSMIDFESHHPAMLPTKLGAPRDNPVYYIGIRHGGGCRTQFSRFLLKASICSACENS